MSSNSLCISGLPTISFTKLAILAHSPWIFAKPGATLYIPEKREGEANCHEPKTSARSGDLAAAVSGRRSDHGGHGRAPHASAVPPPPLPGQMRAPPRLPSFASTDSSSAPSATASPAPPCLRRHRPPATPSSARARTRAVPAERTNYAEMSPRGGVNRRLKLFRFKA